jgi:hypothetical protein
MPVHRVYMTPTAFNDSELAALDYAQVADVVYLAHTNHKPSKLIRAGHTDWSFEDVAFGPTIAAPTGVTATATNPNQDQANSGNAYFPQDASYVVTAVNDDTGQESRASAEDTANNDLALKRNYNTITWSAVTGATSYRIYKSDNQQSYGHIGTTDKLTFRDDNIGPDLSSAPPTGYNPFAAAGDYPATIRFHEQRSWWGRTKNHPNAIYASRSADYENMDYTKPGREDDSIIIGLVSDKVNTINQLVSSKQGLLALTGNHIFTVQGSNEDYITATPPPRVRPEISRGASLLKPIQIDDVTFYETSKSGEIRTIGYQFQIDGLASNDITVFSRHLFANKNIVSWAWVEKPISAVIVILDDGTAVVLTWDQSQEVWGWTTWETDGLYKDVCSITERGEDRIYFVIERTVDGVAKTYIERAASELWEDQVDCCYLDCAKTFYNTGTAAENEAITTYDRLEHLEGETVYAWVDGGVITELNGGPLVVTGGAVTLPHGGSTVTIGKPFTSEIETLPLAMQTPQGWTVARPQHADRAVLRVINTHDILAGVDADNLFEPKQRELEDYGTPTNLLTGDLDVQLAGKSGNEVTITVQSTIPAPMHIAAVLIEPSFGNIG